MSACRIVPLSAAHVGAYADVIRRSFATVARELALTRENCPRHPSFTTDEQWAARITTGYFPFGCFEGEALVGFVSLTDKGEGVFELNSLSVLPERRHLGYGQVLLDVCKSEARDRGGRKIELEIIEENGLLRRWYEKNGFTHTGTKRFEPLPFTVGFMELYL